MQSQWVVTPGKQTNKLSLLDTKDFVGQK